MHHGVNLPRLGGYNLRVVLDCIRRCPEGLSRVEISESTGLSAQTISNVTRRLINDGLVREAGTRNLGMGKPRTILRTEPLAMLAVGVHVDPVMVHTVVVDLACQPIAHREIPTPPDFGPEVAVAEIERSVRELLDDAGMVHPRVAGMGFAVPGPLVESVVVAPPNLPEWHSFDLRAALRERFDWPVFVEKDVISSATGEKWLRGSEGDFGYLYFGTGVGFGLVAKGEVQLGATGNIGEIGHLRVASSGSPCPCCGTPGTLGQLTLPAGIMREARQLGLSTDPEPSHPGAVNEQFRRLCSRAEEPQVRGVFQRLGEHLGSACAVFSDLLDLREIVLGGPYWPLLPEVTFTALRETANSRAILRTVRHVDLTPAHSPHASESVGAASLVFDRLLSANPGQLVDDQSAADVILQ
ncbi:ROK family transcriptional regulator [Arachnia propionica]|nr:ROK family transcriptional regulator [Arachnia propionica]